MDIIEEDLILEYKNVFCDNIFEEILNQDKQKEFKNFINNLPTAPKTKEAFVNFINNLDKEETKQLVHVLYTKHDIYNINLSDYNDKLMCKLFDINCEGVGRGEFMIGWLLTDSIIQGGNVSYDMIHNDKKIEIKDNSVGYSNDVRLGGNSKAANYKWWNLLMKHLIVLRNITKKEHAFLPKEISNDILKYHYDEFYFALNGALPKGRLIKVKKLFLEINIFLKSLELEEGYKQVIFKGINRPFIKANIKTIKDIDIEKSEEIILKIDKSDNTFTNLIIKLQSKSLPYFYNSYLIQDDINAEMEKVIGDKLYVIFRPNGPVITNKLIYTRVSSGMIMVKEEITNK